MADAAQCHKGIALRRCVYLLLDELEDQIWRIWNQVFVLSENAGNSCDGAFANVCVSVCERLSDWLEERFDELWVVELVHEA